MCGILSIIAPAGRPISTDEHTLIRMRDRLEHRGPDDAGLWAHEGVAMAHRRLSVIDPTPDGHQPMLSPDGRYALVYNGELYNDEALRDELEREGARFQTSCDTETVLLTLAQWGEDALTRFRGMFALCFWDTRTRQMLAARDPLGIKPLYHARVGSELVLASEIPAILEHPGLTASPNMRMVSAYLTTIRTVLGDETLFEGVHALEPGQLMRAHASGDSVRVELAFYSRTTAVGEYLPEEEASRRAQGVIEDSVIAHMRSDVPLCALLSGGLDSAITCSIAREHHPSLRTYCAGAPGEPDDDLTWASRVSDELGTEHDEALVDQELFASTWPEMVARMGVPLSTPNEVAIYAVASRLREDGCVVTLSGEGADELFAGYEAPMDSAWQFVASDPASEVGGLFQLDSNAWISRDLKSRLLREDVWHELDNDAWLLEWYTRCFQECCADVGQESGPWRPHLRLHQRVNLVGLLQRLDGATMLASVEGRTPLADRVVMDFANTLSDGHLYMPSSDEEGSVALLTSSRTKRVLRRAFATRLPDGVAQRPKSSFPLPFAQWLPDCAHAMERNGLLELLLIPEAIDAITADPQANWMCAWPVMNLALWGRAHWS
ncbi:MAG: asparagine synthase (glutamine-hydrolyzing) [Phycisphaerales bacterium JB043]